MLEQPDIDRCALRGDQLPRLAGAVKAARAGLLVLVTGTVRDEGVPAILF